MSDKESNFLFNKIANIYGLFYKMQRKNYTKTIDKMKNKIDLSSYKTVIDIGCGTGALCSVLNERGLKVTGIDPAKKMIEVSIRKNKNSQIDFIVADILKGLPFEDSSFDIAFASYVAHGLKHEERKIMYAEMSRIAKNRVIIHDYNKKRSIMTNIIEWLEGGDYFHFIKHAEPEMNDCVSEIKACFKEVEVVNVGKRAAWYICKPIK